MGLFDFMRSSATEKSNSTPPASSPPHPVKIPTPSLLSSKETLASSNQAGESTFNCAVLYLMAHHESSNLPASEKRAIGQTVQQSCPHLNRFLTIVTSIPQPKQKP